MRWGSLWLNYWYNYYLGLILPLQFDFVHFSQLSFISICSIIVGRSWGGQSYDLISKTICYQALLNCNLSKYLTEGLRYLTRNKFLLWFLNFWPSNFLFFSSLLLTEEWTLLTALYLDCFLFKLEDVREQNPKRCEHPVSQSNSSIWYEPTHTL